jgi:hypothetical protein
MIQSLRIILLLTVIFLPQHANSQKLEKEKMVRKDGFIPFLLDEDKGKIYLDVKNLNQEFLYVNSLPAGVGSNDIGLDRGQLGQTRIVEFRKAGNKLLLVEKNYDYRANSNDSDERKAVQDAFAESVLWGFEVIEAKDGSFVVDATSFYLQDVHDVAETLNKMKQGNYKPDNSKSALHFPMIKNFPQNTEVEAIITVSGTASGYYIRSVAPSPNNITVRQRHSFIQLPDAGYKPRNFDPRSGYINISFMDYATPISEPITKRYIARHRLEKKDPSAPVSEPVKPIIYYLDRGTPEPIRAALLEGGNWWAEAFEAAGFKNAFRVEMLPEDADPMDVRYNMINWVHRSTRGWSYGASVKDPRTGEIIKGQVSLGSLRVRQDYMIAEGLLQPYEDGKAIQLADASAEKSAFREQGNKQAEEMALSRLRQLSAHEIGHTIGISHSYASSPSGRASVMDYPYPYFEMDAQGNIDLSKAYDDKIGEWDKWAIKYGYTQFEEGVDEDRALAQILEDTYSNGLEFISDVDARSPSGSHPRAHLWDNGKDAADELNRLMDIRKTKLTTFGVNVIRKGTPLSVAGDVLVPLYLMHRYQIEATAKLVGGIDYTYKVKGDNQPQQKRVERMSQEKAMNALLRSLSPEELTLPESILAIIPPQPMGYFSRGRESFSSRSGLNFDPVAAAEASAATTLKYLLEPGRLNRVVQQHYLDRSQLSLNDLLDKLLAQTVYGSLPTGIGRDVKMLTDKLVVEQMIYVTKNKYASHSVQAMVHQKLKEMIKGKASMKIQIDKNDPQTVAHTEYLKSMIKKYLDSPLEMEASQPASIPDGAPIGMTEFLGCDH